MPIRIPVGNCCKIYKEREREREREREMPNWELKKCCNHEQVVFLTTTAVCAVVILAV